MVLANFPTLTAWAREHTSFTGCEECLNTVCVCTFISWQQKLNKGMWAQAKQILLKIWNNIPRKVFTGNGFLSWMLPQLIQWEYLNWDSTPFSFLLFSSPFKIGVVSHNNYPQAPQYPQVISKPRVLETLTDLGNLMCKSSVYKIKSLKYQVVGTAEFVCNFYGNWL